MKKIISIYISAVMLFLCSSTVSAQMPAPITMTIDDAVSYTLEHSTTLSKCNAAIISAEYQLYQAKSAKKNILKAESITSDSYLIASGYAQEAAQMQYEMSKRSKIITEQSVTVQLKKDFYSYLNSLEVIKNAENNLSNAEEKLKAAEYQFTSGAISELDYKNFQLLKINAQNSLNSAIRNKDILFRTLKNTMNYTEEAELIPVGSITYVPEEILDPDSAILLSKDTPSYQNINDAFSLAERKWYLTKIHFTSATFNFKIEEAAYNTAISDRTESINNLELGIRQTYNSLITLSEQISALEFNLDILKNSAEASFLRFEMGSLSAASYNDTVQKYTTAENELQNLKLTYLTTKLTYENMYSTK